MRVRTGSATGGRFGIRLVGIIAVLIAIAGQPLPTSADEPRTDIHYVFYLEAEPDKSLADLCIDDVVRLNVKAQRSLANLTYLDTETNTSPPVQLYGVRINASLRNPEVGDLLETVGQTASNASPPGSAPFLFKATKAGTTAIVFTRSLPDRSLLGLTGTIDFIPDELEATVSDCEYSVNVTSHWHTLKSDNTALVSDVRLKPSNTGAYSGSGMWTLIRTTNPPVGACPPHTQLVQAPVDIVASRDPNQLNVAVMYEGAHLVWTISRTDACETTQTTATSRESPQALLFHVPASGSSLTLVQSLTDTLANHFGFGDADGSAFVTVARVRPQ